jgi:4-amino-4-deoxy-L-arabinose transferase-like glycosyltransferase
LAGPLPDAETRDYAIAQGITGEFELLPYEAMQPPLYYLTAGSIAYLAPPDPQTVLYLGRIVAAFFGALTVYFCWAAIRELAPQEHLWAVAGAGLVALLPQFCSNSASLNNDSAAGFAAAAAFYIWIRGLRNPNFDRWMLGAGAIMGICLLAKLTTLVFLPGLALVVLFRAFQVPAQPDIRSARFASGLRKAAGAAAALVLVCGWWFVRNIFVYGEISGSEETIRFYSARFDPIVLGNLADIGLLARGTWESLWGRFGWMDVPLPDTFYTQALIISVVLVSLSLIAGLRRIALWITRKGQLPAYVWQSTLVMAVASVLMVYAFYRYNAEVASQPQARYFFTLLLPLALVFTCGLFSLIPWRAVKMVCVIALLTWSAIMNGVGLAAISAAQ